MKLITFLLLKTSLILAANSSLDLNQLKTGDIILQPLSCWVCSLIEAQEQSKYSHMGVFVRVKQEAFVLEAFQDEVKLTSFEQFKNRTAKNKSLKIRRWKNFKLSPAEFKQLYTPYLGLKYDKEFLWENVDEKGLEKMYCSELVYKLFANFMQDLPIKRMQFDVYTAYWFMYFNGHIPFNEWGVSPEDFNQSDLLKDIGKL